MIPISDRTILVNGIEVRLDYAVEEAFESNGRIIVLLDPDAYTEKFGQFPNLLAVSPSGNRLWTAELPTTDPGDRYYKITSRAPLIASSIWSYECEIDPATGKIKNRIFYK